MARSSVYINAISNRISASSTRTQFLGMAVGMAVSGLVAPPDQRLKFESDELESENGRWYASLVHIDDKVGSLEDLTLLKGDSGATKKPTSKPQATKRKVGKPVAQSKIIEIEEIDDGSENGSDSDEIPVFAKPDSDPEDEDEDPTLIERNKPTAPV